MSTKTKKGKGKTGHKNRSSFFMYTSTLWWRNGVGDEFAITPDVAVSCEAKGLFVKTTVIACQVCLDEKPGERKLSFPLQEGGYMTVGRGINTQPTLYASTSAISCSYQIRSEVSKYGGSGLEHQSIQGWPGTGSSDQLTCRDISKMFTWANPCWSYMEGGAWESIVWKDVDRLGTPAAPTSKEDVQVIYTDKEGVPFNAPDFRFLALADHNEDQGFAYHPQDVKRKLYKEGCKRRTAYATQYGYATKGDLRLVRSWEDKLAEDKQAGLVSVAGRYYMNSGTLAPKLFWVAASNPMDLDRTALSKTGSLMRGLSVNARAF